MITNVMAYLYDSAEKYPDSVALADEKTSITYKDLLLCVKDRGRALYARLGCIGNPVPVCIRRCVCDVISFLAVVYSGNFYIPLDLSLPSERVRSILDTVSPRLVLGEEPEKLKQSFDGEMPFDFITASDLSAPRRVAENGDASCRTAKDPAEPWRSCRDTDLLYVIFTSGSTGTPKGVAIRHRSVIDMAEQFTDTFGFTHENVFGNQAPFDFDVSVKDLYISLKGGARVEILEKKLFSFPKLLTERMNERQIDTVIWAVPALNIPARLDAFKGAKPEHLRNIFFSGEVMPSTTLSYWRNHYPGARFVNLYGPTEITCNCTYHILRENEDLSEGIPIGTAFPNCDVFLVSENGEAVPDGEVGEICVCGTCLAAGYYARADLTSAAFVQDPFEKKFPELMYRTGDMGVFRNGVLMFRGRRDTQIKHMGHRIELTEIELCADRFPGVERCACVYLEEKERIFLYYLGKADEKELLLSLRGHLPPYMLPGRVVKLDVFPATRTGKTDRKALLAMASGE